MGTGCVTKLATLSAQKGSITGVAHTWQGICPSISFLPAVKSNCSPFSAIKAGQLLKFEALVAEAEELMGLLCMEHHRPLLQGTHQHLSS
jgi:hypothetical protein